MYLYDQKSTGYSIFVFVSLFAHYLPLPLICADIALKKHHTNRIMFVQPTALHTLCGDANMAFSASFVFLCEMGLKSVLIQGANDTMVVVFFIDIYRPVIVRGDRGWGSGTLPPGFNPSTALIFFLPTPAHFCPLFKFFPHTHPPIWLPPPHIFRENSPNIDNHCHEIIYVDHRLN